jgi:hypothetical protein
MAGSSYTELLEEYERSTAAAVPHYRPANEFRPAERVARDGEPPARPAKLAFTAPPPLPTEPSFSERLEPLLQPLRARVEAAEEVYHRAAEEASQRDSMRLDLDRAAASVRNLSTDPQPRRTPPTPKAAFEMSDSAWEAHKQAIRDGEF